MTIGFETIVKDVVIAVPAIVAVGAVGMFALYRADYIRLGMEEPTLLAYKLTISTLRDFARFRKGEKPAHRHARKGDATKHEHHREADVDMGTVNRPLTPSERHRLTPKERRRDE